jgi:hypothetical protein
MTKWADCRLSDGHAISYQLRHSDGKWLPLPKSACSRKPESETAGGGEDEAVPAAERCVPSGAQAPEVETAHLRDLLLEGPAESIITRGMGLSCVYRDLFA